MGILSLDKFLKSKLGENYQAYSSNTVWLILERLFRLSVNLYVSAWVAQYLGPEDFGILNFVLSYAGIFTIIGLLGLDHIIISQLIKNPENKEKIISSSFYLKFLGTIFSWILLLLVMHFFPIKNQDKWLIISISFFSIFRSLSIFELELNANLKSKFSTYCITASIAISSSIKLYLISIKSDLFFFLITYGFEILIQYILMSILSELKFSIIFKYFDKNIAFLLLNKSKFTLLSGLLLSTFIRVDQILIVNIEGNHANGIYAVASRLNEAWHFLPLAICNSLFPSLVKNVDNFHEYRKRIILLKGALTSINLTIILLTYFFSEAVIGHLYGSDFSESKSVLNLLIISSIFVSINIINERILIIEQSEKNIFLKNFFSLILNSILCYLLIQKYSIYGAAISLFISYFFMTILGSFFEYESIRKREILYGNKKRHC